MREANPVHQAAYAFFPPFFPTLRHAPDPKIPAGIPEQQPAAVLRERQTRPRGTRVPAEPPDDLAGSALHHDHLAPRGFHRQQIRRPAELRVPRGGGQFDHVREPAVGQIPEPNRLVPRNRHHRLSLIPAVITHLPRQIDPRGYHRLRVAARSRLLRAARQKPVQSRAKTKPRLGFPRE